MSDHDAEVAAVLKQRFDVYEFPAAVHGDRRSLKLTTEQAIEVALAALSAAGIRCLYVPEGVEVEHGARLVDIGRYGRVQLPVFAIAHQNAIEATP